MKALGTADWSHGYRSTAWKVWALASGAALVIDCGGLLAQEVAGVGFADAEIRVNESSPAVGLWVLRGSDDREPFTVSYETRDGTARAGSDYVAASGTLAFGEGESVKMLEIQLLNDVLPEPEETFTVRLSNPGAGRRFDPQKTVVTVRIIDNDPGVGFREKQLWVNEAQGVAVLVVRRGSDRAGAFMVQYGTADGTARAGADYVEASGTLEFGETEESKTIEIELLNDAQTELEETFTVRLSNPSGGHLLDPHNLVATLRIEDNDPGVGFAGNELWVYENQGMATLIVRRGSDRAGAFTVQYATANGTARAGSDYVEASGTLEFVEDDDWKTLEIELLNDAWPEPEETFSVRLSSPSAGHQLDPQSTVATVRIADNDRGVGFAPTWYTVPEDAGVVELRVVRQTDDPAAFGVAYSTRAGGQRGIRGTAGEDYVESSGVLEFAEGENFKAVRIEILNDGKREEPEEFQVYLHSVTGSGIRLFEATATVVIQDNDPGVHYDPVKVQISEAELSVMLTVHRGADTIEAFQVAYATRAIPGSRQTAHPSVTGTIEFGEGEHVRTLVIPLPGDNQIWEGDQEFEVVLSGPTAVGVLDPDRSVGRVVVVDDDAPLRWEAHWVGEEFPEVWGLQAVTWGGGRYVVVGGEWALVSEDARTWTAQRVPGFEVWDVLWANDEYVAVGEAGVWRSADGLEWSRVAGPAPRNLFRVTYGQGVYVALDRDERAWRTPNLEDWSSETLGPNLQDLAYGDQGFVVVGGEGRAWHAAAGSEWTALGKIAPGWLGAVVWGEAGYVTACSQYDEQRQTEYLLVFSSVDGRNWQTNRVDEPVSTPNYLVYGDGAYVGVSWSRVVRLVWAGEHWQVESSSGISSYWFGMGDLAYGSAGYVTPSSSTVAISADGLLWERLHRPDFTDVHLADGQILVEHVNGDRWHWSYFEIRSSPDAESWSIERSGGFGGGTGSGLVSLGGVVGDLRGGKLHLRKKDGSWRPVSFAEQGWVRDVAAGGGTWVVVGRRHDEAAGQDRVVVYRSVDGQDWAAQHLGFHGELSRVFHAGEWFYAVGYQYGDGGGEIMFQSTDGIAWRRSGLSGNYELYAVTYGQGNYVAAARDSRDDQRVVLRSIDGVNWAVAKQLNIVDVWSADIEYGSGLFMLTWRGWRGRGSPEGVMTYLSMDGIDWKRHTPRLDASISALDYADGRFVAAGRGGLVLRSQPLVYLGDPRRDASGSITVSFEGEGGREYAVEGSSDLVEWTAVGTVRPASSAQEIILPPLPTGHRFYRLTGSE